MAGDATELDTAFQCLYPGALADWFAARQRHPPITNYRDYTSRQTGMYRVTTMLSDGQVAAVGRAGCKPRFCLKQRLWTVNGLAPDESSAKSLLSCLEPCAVLLEFARSAARIEQGQKFGVSLSSEEVRTLIGALEGSLAKPFLAAREADFSDLGNPRRVQLILEKLRQVLGAKDEQEHS